MLGKDPLRIDRSGVYAARHAAKNVVAAGLAKECEVMLAYSIGLSRPVSIRVETFNTGKIPDDDIAQRLERCYDFRPAAIVRDLELRRLRRQLLPATGRLWSSGADGSAAALGGHEPGGAATGEIAFRWSPRRPKTGLVTLSGLGDTALRCVTRVSSALRCECRVWATLLACGSPLDPVVSAGNERAGSGIPGERLTRSIASVHLRNLRIVFLPLTPTRCVEANPAWFANFYYNLCHLALMELTMSHAATLSIPSCFGIDDLLGGPRVLTSIPRSALDWVSMIRHGIPSTAVDALTQSTHLTQAELAAAVGIPERTLARRKREGRLTSEESSRLVRLARAVARGEEVFEDLAAAVDWLKSPNASLAGATPLNLLDTDIGAETVMDTLGRIEHGVFA